jgi:hypothetical protein
VYNGHPVRYYPGIIFPSWGSTVTPPSGENPPLRPPWYWLFRLALGLVPGLLGATLLADVAGFPPPYTGMSLLLRGLCGLGIGLATLAVVQFPDRSPLA